MNILDGLIMNLIVYALLNCSTVTANYQYCLYIADQQKMACEHQEARMTAKKSLEKRCNNRQSLTENEQVMY